MANSEDQDPFENVTNVGPSAANTDDFLERVNPHEFTGERRVQWQQEVWQAFCKVSHNGVISLFDMKKIAEDLRVDGDETTLDGLVQESEKQNITFSKLVKLLDTMSKSSSEEYRDVDLNQVDKNAFELLSPMEYLARCCGAQDDEESHGAYKLQVFKYFEVTPKLVLVSSTGALMMLICCTILVGMAITWSVSSSSREKKHVDEFHSTTFSLIGTLEKQMLETHSLSMVDQAAVAATWTEVLFLQEKTSVRHRGYLAAERVTTALQSVIDNTQSGVTSLAVRKETLAELQALGVDTVGQRSRIDAIYKPLGLTARSCSVGESAVASNNVSSLCLGFTGAHPLPEAAAKKAAATAMDAINIVIAEHQDWSHITTALVQNGEEVMSKNGGDCYDLDGENLCANLWSQVKKVTSSLSTTTNAFLNISQFTNVFILPKYPTFHVVRMLPVRDLLRYSRSRTVSVVNYLNTNAAKRTEIVISIRNESTGEIIPQATEYRYKDACLLTCARIEGADGNIKVGYQTKGAGWAITPDYRPRAVTSAYSYVGEDLDMVILVGRDVRDIRAVSFEAVVNILDSVNSLASGSLELMLLGWEGMITAKYFYAYDPCPSKTDCYVDPRGTENVNGSLGVMLRYECKHCARVTEVLHKKAIMYTRPKKKLSGCATTAVSCNVSFSNDFVNMLLDEQGRTQTDDYVGDSVYASYGLIENFSSTLVAKIDRSENMNTITTKILISVGAGIGFMIVGMIVVVFLSQQSFRSIEEEWAQYKKQIEREKTKFASLVRGVIPPQVAERLMKGTRVIADHINIASFAFVDICGFSEMTKTWTSKNVARFATYCFAVMEEAGNYCDMAKLRCIGDLYSCVGQREEKHKNSADLHPAFRAMHFSSMIMLLFSKMYSHYPQNCKMFRDIFKDKMMDRQATTDMPSIRIGVHCGPTVQGAYSIGRTSHYDFFGIGPSLANRMQQTAQPNRIHVTMMVVELLKKRDTERIYTFEAPRKTVVRGQGTITSYYVKSMAQAVPKEVTQVLAIERSMIVYSFESKKKADGSASSRSGKSSQSGQSQDSGH